MTPHEWAKMTVKGTSEVISDAIDEKVEECARLLLREAPQFGIKDVDADILAEKIRRLKEPDDPGRH